MIDVKRCAICNEHLPNEAHEYGDRERPCCFNCWMGYLDWQQRVNAAEDKAFAAFQGGGDEVQAMVIELADYMTFVEPDDVEADVLEQYDLLPEHISPRIVKPSLNPPAGPLVMDPDRSPQNREAAGW